MRNILLITITALIAVSTGLSLEPMKVGFVYTAGTPTSVQVQLADNTSSNLFQGENYTTGITPNSSGVIVVNVRDHAGSGTTWANYQASSVNTYSTLDIYVNGTLYAQYRLDALIISQAQNGILDQDGNLTPPENGSGNVGTDELRWSSAYFDENTVHIGPAEGEANDSEMRLSYDHGIHTGTITIDDEDVIDATSDLVTINKLVSQVIAGNNTAFGNTAFNGTSSGASNTAIGYLSLSANTNGNNNTAVGTSSLRNNTSGAQNTAVGVDALITNTSGISNTAVGYLSLSINNANNNTAFGTSSLRNNSSGTNNTAVGTNALSSNTIGNNNTANGFQALMNSTGTNNTAVGYNALLVSTANDNTAIGSGSLASNTTGTVNTAVGHLAMFNNIDGNFNTAIGRASLQANTSGFNNTAIGRASLYLNTDGRDNTAAGGEALRNNGSGFQNVSVGVKSLFNNTTGNNNTAIGTNSGNTLVDGSFNLFLGFNAGNNASQKIDAQNSIAIGANTFTTADNQVVIGNSFITETQLRGATLVDLAGGGTQNIQVDNNGKIITGGGGGGGTANGNGSTVLTINNPNINASSAITLTIESPLLNFYDYSILSVGPGSFVIFFNNPINPADKVHYTFVNP